MDAAPAPRRSRGARSAGCDLHILKPPGTLLGAILDNMLLVEVHDGGAVAAAGGRAFIGRSLLKVNGEVVSTRRDVARIAGPCTEMVFTFTPLPRGPARVRPAAGGLVGALRATPRLAQLHRDRADRELGSTTATLSPSLTASSAASEAESTPAHSPSTSPSTPVSSPAATPPPFRFATAATEMPPAPALV